MFCCVCCCYLFHLSLLHQWHLNTTKTHTHTNHTMINKPTQFFFNKKIWYQSHKHNHQHSFHTHYYNTTFQK
jgi:hypothetical protein